MTFKIVYFKNNREVSKQYITSFCIDEVYEVANGMMEGMGYDDYEVYDG
jgi:hypothetical protein